MSVAAALAALVGTALPAHRRPRHRRRAPARAHTARVDDAGTEQRYVPAGCFRMGTTDVQAADARRLDVRSHRP